MDYALAPWLPDFRIESIETNDNEYFIVARAMSATADCPDYGQQSRQVHSWYERSLCDLPSFGAALRLSLQVRRLFCRTLSCARRLSCERLPHFMQTYARRTQRLAETLITLAFALGGKDGERTKIGIPASRRD